MQPPIEAPPGVCRQYRSRLQPLLRRLALNRIAAQLSFKNVRSLSRICALLQRHGKSMSLSGSSDQQNSPRTVDFLDFRAAQAQ